MNKFNLDSQLKSLAQENNEKSIPAFFSNGLEETLNQLPDREAPIMKKTNRKKRTWLYTAAAVGILSTGILGSGFASPAMAAALSKVPGLHYIFSADYKDLNTVEENPNVQYGSTFQFGDGESGPYGEKIAETEIFNGYTDELMEYVGADFPKIIDGKVSFVRVDKYNNQQQFEITASVEVNKEPVVLSVVPNALNQPQFNGYSVKPVVESKVDVNGIEADVLSYQFSKTDKKDVTNYISWERNGYSMVLASTMTIEELAEVSQKVDEMAAGMEAKVN